MIHTNYAHPLEFFENIFVINLKSRPDRKAEMMGEFTKIGFPLSKVTWFNAVRPPDAGPFESIGARGCFMSHLSVLKEAVSSGANRLMLMEDDCSFSPDFVSRMSLIVDELENDHWDVFYGGGGTVTPQPSQNGLSRIPVDCGVVTTHCLSVNGSAIAKICAYIELQLSRPLGDPEGGPMHVDGSYSWARRELNLTTFMADPTVAKQRFSRSDIASQRFWDRLPIVRNVVQQARVVRNRMFPL